jgi:hypothetical protein
MKTFQVSVTDQRGKYVARNYTVSANDAMTAEFDAVDKFIADNGHPPYVPGKSRASTYYSRFFASAK